jgi:hypothetical protein
MMIFVLIVTVAGAALYAQAISGTTPHVTIAFVGDTLPIAGIYHVSVAGITTYNATSSRNTEQKLITVSWGDGISNQSKLTRILSSSEGKWGPLYRKYDSATSSNAYAIVATLDALSSSSSNNKGIMILHDIQVSVGGHHVPVAPEVQAQTTSSCDRDVGSLVDCWPSTSSSRTSEDSSVTHDSDEKDNDNGGNSEEEKEEKKSGDIES